MNSPSITPVPLLKLEGLSKSFGGVHAVRDVSFEMNAGTIVALIGPNGAGKTTCFNLLNGQLRPDTGRIFVNGRDVTGYLPRRIFRLGIGRTFQVAEPFHSMTVRENVRTALLSHRKDIWNPWKQAKRYFNAEVDELLIRVKLIDQGDRPCAVLAYGDLKRLDLAIALANQPHLLLMDEPAAGMAPKERIALMQLTASIVGERNIGVLFTEHDMDIVFAHADKIIVLHRGSVLAAGAPSCVRQNLEVQEIYLGSKRHA